jgi:predicted RecA/RadA family phage recombinase
MTQAVVSGQLLQVGKFIGVASVNGNIGDTIEVALEGVFTLPKTPADVITQGQGLHFIPATGIVDAGATVLFGVAAAACRERKHYSAGEIGSQFRRDDDDDRNRASG